MKQSPRVMSEAKYDEAARFYADFVKNALDSPTSVLRVITEEVVTALGEIEGLHICDVACGEGHLSRYLAQRGAQVTGVDISGGLLEQARIQTSETLPVSYLQDDVQSLTELGAQTFDAAVINMALMDVAEHQGAFGSCHRILKPGGRFVFSVLHPCFESPFDAEYPPTELSETGEFVACRVRRYLEEGFWSSGGEGVRGRVGAYHRTLSTYLNDLLASGFQLQAIVEPTLPKRQYETVEEQWFSKILKGLVIKSVKV